MRFGLLSLALVLLCLISACKDSGGSKVSDINPIDAETSCLVQSPWLAYGEGLHASAISSVSAPASDGTVNSITQCNGNTVFQFGAAKADITGPAGGKIHMGNESPENYSTGIHIRQYARSFVVASPCNGKRVVMAITDTGMLFESVRKAVLDRISADPDLSPLYNENNVMMSATHTHSTPGGQAHFTAYNALRLGHDAQTFNITVEGLFNSIKQAHDSLRADPQSGSIAMNLGELTGANKSRAIPAYMQNTEAERALYKDVLGNDVTTPRLMTLLKFQHGDGRAVGSMNWFAVHPTSDALSEYGLGAIPISGDNKGYAAYLFERFMQPHNPGFVSSFMQSDEGDAFTQMWFDDDEKRAEQEIFLPSNEPSPVTVANGQKQLLKALNLYAEAKHQLSGPIDYRFGYVQMDQVEITDSVVLNSLQHPAEQDAQPKRTCNPAMGVSFPAAGHGAQPGEPGLFTEAGVTCKDPDLAQLLADEFRQGSGGNVPTNLFAATVGCNAGSLPGLNLECHAEKPLLLIFGPPLNASATVVPFQLFRLGNLAVVGLPWEITTMAGRRIRDTLIDVLKEDGVDHVVITGLANDYVSYLTTREEYALQMYEAASNQFGPWSLAAVQQETRRLALDMVNASVTQSGPVPPVTSPQLFQLLPPQGTDLAPPGSVFGAVIVPPEASYKAGETVRTVFQASSPNSDLKTDSSFLFVERQLADNTWEVIAQDADPQTSFVWHSDTPQPQANATLTSTAEILWRIPRNTQAGIYRIKFSGVSNQASILSDYEGISEEFVVSGPTSNCP
ncbi:neutral/alkaline non-lysosomal ceramidase N-terminal domain-containing protein [Zhongshania sp.]|jgi:neutral ceramidase|uniref:neutral/alkaline non-lysosomal ceramidase N-terminal domain-containing protein n=1 Tax=Zhongshania sp. TaxID=1971902 RepID=UPI0039E48F03